MKHKQRLDILLTERGLCDSRSRAQALIMSGEVFVNGQKCDKAGTLIEEDAALELRGGSRYVSRGGLKLEKALRDFGIDPTGFVCSDSGASRAVLLIACSRTARRRCLLSMSVTASLPGPFARIRVLCAWSARIFVM